MKVPKMKKLFITLALTATFSAHAGNYSDAASIESLCSLVGSTTARTYQNRMSGISKDEAAATVRRQFGDNPNSMEKAPVIIAYELATDERDAYRRGWAYCMDTVNKSNTSAKSDSKKADKKQASAGDQSAAVNIDKKCDEFSTYMVAAFDRRKSPEYRKEIKEILAEDAANSDSDPSSVRIKKAYRLAVNYALDKATSRKDAYMTASRYCMARAK